MNRHYYIHRVSCKVHNKKTQALNAALARFNFTLVEFSDTFTPDGMFCPLAKHREGSEHQGQEPRDRGAQK